MFYNFILPSSIIRLQRNAEEAEKARDYLERRRDSGWEAAGWLAVGGRQTLLSYPGRVPNQTLLQLQD